MNELLVEGDRLDNLTSNKERSKMAKVTAQEAGSTGGAGMMRQQQQMQQKILKMQQEMEKGLRPMWKTPPSLPPQAAVL